MVKGLLLNRSSTAETIDFQNQAKKIVAILPGFANLVSHHGAGTVRGLEIHGGSCQQIADIATTIMREVAFPKKMAGEYTLEFFFRPDNTEETS